MSTMAIGFEVNWRNVQLLEVDSARTLCGKAANASGHIDLANVHRIVL